MSLLGKIWVKLGLDNSEFKKGINESQNATGKFKNFLGGLGGQIAAAFSVGAVISFAKKSVQAYNESAAAITNLNSVLKATQGAVGLTSRELQNYASDLQKVTTFEDDATIAAMSVLATFKGIKGDVFKDVVKSAMDMATIFGGDLQSSISLLGKALERPAEGINLLQRSTRAFSELQIQVVKDLVAEGKTQEAQMLILTTLQGKFGGAAKAAALTAQGAWKQLGNTLGDIQEELGKGVEKTKGLAQGLNDYLKLALAMSKADVGLIKFWKALTGNKNALNEITASLKNVADRERQVKADVEKTMSAIKSQADAEKKLLEIQNDKGDKAEALRTALQAYVGEQAKVVTGETAIVQAKKDSILYTQKLIEELKKQIDLETSETKRAAMNQDLANLENQVRVMQLRTAELKDYNALIKRGKTKLPNAPKIPSAISNFKLSNTSPVAPTSSGLQKAYDPILSNENYKKFLAERKELTLQAQEDAQKAIEEINKQSAQLEITGEQMAQAITQSIGGAVDELVTSLVMTGKVDTASVVNALMQPFFDMGKQLGEELIAFAVGSIALDTLITNPYTALAAGIALVGLSAAASAAMNATVQKKKQNSSQSNATSFTGGYGGFNTANAVSSQMTPALNIQGVLKGEDIYLSVQKTEAKRSR